MDLTYAILDRLLHAFVQGLIQPFYLIGILFVVFQYHKQIQLERKLFSTRLHSLIDTTWRTVLGGITAGFIGSVAMAFIGATLTQEALWWIWGISILLALFRIRFLCMAYAVGVLGVLHVMATLFFAADSGGVFSGMIHSLQELPIPALIALVGVLHLMEAFLVKWQGSKMAMPLFLENKRGRIIGGYRIQQFWPAPLFLLVPMAGGASTSLPWTPYFGGDLWAAGWTIAAFPVILGYAETTLSRLPQTKVAESAKRLVMYSILLIGLAALTEWQSPLIALASFLVFGLHEVIIWLGNRVEHSEGPRFVHDDKGLKILAVLPNGPGVEMGLEAGEVIIKVNGVPVNTKLELHQALTINPTYCKLEVLNLEGHSKFVGRALFAGDHHLLGVILCPDDSVRYYVSSDESSLIGLWKRSWKGSRARTHTGETI